MLVTGLGAAYSVRTAILSYPSVILSVKNGVLNKNTDATIATVTRIPLG